MNAKVNGCLEVADETVDCSDRIEAPVLHLTQIRLLFHRDHCTLLRTCISFQMCHFSSCDGLVGPPSTVEKILHVESSRATCHHQQK